MHQSTLRTENQEHTNTLNEANQVNTVHAPSIQSLAAVKMTHYTASPAGSHERLVRFAQMQTDHDGVVGVAL